ncbi:MAG: OmpH family outer membrane protein [Saprospiraceae bacterium]
MKNISLILNAILILAVGHLYYLNMNKSKGEKKPAAIETAPAAEDGVKIAYVNIDTLDAKYEWLKEQKDALEKSQRNKEANLKRKQDAFVKDMEAFQAKYQSGTVPPAQLEAEYNKLTARQQSLVEEEARLSKQLGEEYTKAMDELMSNVEVQLKSLQSDIGYDFILSYSKGGGQVLLANDSLEITNQVLELLNTSSPKEGATDKK